jgi:hypothetical protein
MAMATARSDGDGDGDREERRRWRWRPRGATATANATAIAIGAPRRGSAHTRNGYRRAPRRVSMASTRLRRSSPICTSLEST